MEQAAEDDDDASLECRLVSIVEIVCAPLHREIEQINQRSRPCRSSTCERRELTLHSLQISVVSVVVPSWRDGEYQQGKVQRTWMMNKKMGFFGSYLLGLSPSKIPPCGVARSVGAGEDDAEAVTIFVVVTTEASIDDMVGEDLAGGARLVGGRPRRLLCRVESPRGCLCRSATLPHCRTKDRTCSRRWRWCGLEVVRSLQESKPCRATVR